MRRAAAISVGMLCGLCLLLLAAGLGSLSRTAQVTFGGADNTLNVYDVSSGRSAPFVRGIEDLPVTWSWSPDGARLAYVLLDGDAAAYTLMLWTPQLRRATLIADLLPFGAPPQWSPDGREIAFIDPNQDICIYPLTGAPPDCLGVQPAGQPVWSPDGTAIAYLSRLPEGGLWRVEREDRRARPLLTGIGGLNYPAWSPDGASIAFSAPSASSGLRHLYLVPSGGGARRALTGGDTEQDQPVWSPDGRYIAYNAYPPHGGEPDIAVIEVATSEITRVTAHPQNDTDPRWSPDGRYLAFVSDRPDRKPRLYIVPVGQLADAEPFAVPGLDMSLYAYAWRP